MQTLNEEVSGETVMECLALASSSAGQSNMCLSSLSISFNKEYQAYSDTARTYCSLSINDPAICGMFKAIYSNFMKWNI